MMEYDVKFSDRKTLGLTVERDASVVVRAPKGTSWERIEEFVEKRALWIKEKQNHPQKYRPPRPIKEFVSGESVLYMGRNYRLNIKNENEAFVRLSGKFFICGPRQADLKALFRQWFIERAKHEIPPRAQLYAERMGVSFKTVMISDMKYRWGSCTPSMNVNFNWRLIKAPVHVIDYVIVHELAHLLEHNHSERFWQHVRTQIQNFQSAKSWLKENGQCLEEEF